MTHVDVAVDVRQDLGESVLWDDRTGELVWVNIHAGEVWCLATGSGRLIRHQLPDRVGAIGLREGRGYVVALAKGFGLFDPLTEQVDIVAPVEPDIPRTRLNDGRVDRFGNFVSGGMNEGGPGSPASALYRLRPDGRLDVLLTGVSCANSTCFSPDGRRMYFADMPTGRIESFAYDPAGPLGRPEFFFAFDGLPGLPDGSTIDSEGYLWTTHWGGGCITRHAPDGTIDQRVDVPATNPTCLAFGGDDLRTLYITTATFGLGSAEIARKPLSGAVLSMRVDVPGLPEPRFAA